MYESMQTPSSFLHQHNAAIQWLLEPDDEQPAIRYFAVRDLLGSPENDDEVQVSRERIGTSGPVFDILNAQHPDGYWVKPGAGYSPKYTGTVWQLIFLSQFGSDGTDPRVRQACEYVLSHARAGNGAISMSGSPSGFIHCLSGNLLSALLDLGMGNDTRVREAIELQARFVTGEGVAPPTATATPRYYRSGTLGPDCACANNDLLPCAWGAIKALTVFGKVPEEEQSETVQRAIRRSISLLLGHDPAVADYPSVYGETPSANWFKFGYPLGYSSDVLQNLEALERVGMVADQRVSNAVRLIESKREPDGRWLQEYRLKGPTWFCQEALDRPSKWVTLRALRVLKSTAAMGRH